MPYPQLIETLRKALHLIWKVGFKLEERWGKVPRRGLRQNLKNEEIKTQKEEFFSKLTKQMKIRDPPIDDSPGEDLKKVGDQDRLVLRIPLNSYPLHSRRVSLYPYVPPPKPSFC
jgi:hypothetical protein